MRIITIARKPLEAESTTANVVQHECGAINIDGTRVAGPAWTRSTETLEDIRGGRYGTASKDRIVTGPREMPKGGRWPANVLLKHRAACRIIGMRKVQTGLAVREKSGGRTIFSETKKPPLPNMTYADEGGFEAVPEWDCAPDCPVAKLDGDFEIDGQVSRYFKQFGGKDQPE